MMHHLEGSVWAVWIPGASLDTVRFWAAGYPELYLTQDQADETETETETERGECYLYDNFKARELDWVSLACRLAGTSEALGGSFAAVLVVGQRCVFCTDFLGRQPLYYRVRHTDEGLHQLELCFTPTELDTVDAWIRHHPRTRIAVDAEGRVTREAASQLGDMLGVVPREVALQEKFVESSIG